MKVIATGKWSKAEKRWNKVIALHRPPAGTSGSPLKRSEPRRAIAPRSQQRSDA
jgi:hypothetical protein